ncbi:hypothetical protein [Flagellimonas sp. W118]|uniref:hypothetical protein n=1 Tax=Flagellimonas sp. W118 TaxID=3410791 RepID=UPI003BF4D0DD
MKKLILILFAVLMVNNIQSQDNIKKNPVVQDLDFLIGTWEVEFDWYNTHNPGSESEFSEKGTMVCYYDLDYRGTKKFIFCKFSLHTDKGRLKGRYRETLEVIQWSKFSNAFEKTGVFSNWPATGTGTFIFDPLKRTFYYEGELGVQDGMIEKMVETYQFNEDYTAFEKRNIANFSDMPITEFNLTMTCKAKKRTTEGK